MKNYALNCVLAGLAVSASYAVNATTIDGTIGVGEWTGPGITTNTIGNGGGTAYFRADTSYLYAAFDITGWLSSYGAASHGNLLGLGVWDTNNSYPNPPGIELQQATDPNNWGPSVPVSSGTLNGLDTAYRWDSFVQNTITGIQAADSFATGHRVWEVRMDLAHMGGLLPGDSIWVVGGINYEGQQHWYPDTFVPGYQGYTEIKVAAVPPPAAAPVPGTVALLGLGMLALGWSRKNRSLA